MTEETQEQVNETQTQDNTERFVERNGERINVSENFWDAKNNTPDVFAILKSQQDLRKQIGEDASPKDGIYQINIPDELKDKLQADPEDPLYKEFCKVAKAKRFSQADFDALSQIYYKQLYDKQQDFDSEDYYKKESEALKEKFGNKLDQVKTRIDNFVKNCGISNQDMLNELQFMQTSAAGVMLLDYFLDMRGEPMPREITSKAGKLSLDELRKLQSQEGYQNGTDQALINKVRQGYIDLYDN